MQLIAFTIDEVRTEDVLDVLPDEIKQYQWFLYENEGNSIDETKFKNTDLYGPITPNNAVGPIDFNELRMRCEPWDQQWFVYATGFSPQKHYQDYRDEFAEIIIELVDSGFWKITSSEISVLTELENFFKSKGVEEIELT